MNQNTPAPNYPAERRLRVAQAFRDHANETRSRGPCTRDLDPCEEDDRITADIRRRDHWTRWTRAYEAAVEEVRVAEGLLSSYEKPAGTRYYVSARQYEDAVICAGPFADHETALRAVPAVRRIAYELYPLTFPCSWGTCSTPPDVETAPVNERINAAFNAPPPPPAPAPAPKKARKRTPAGNRGVAAPLQG